MNDRPPFTDDDAWRLGETAGEHRIDTATEAREAALALARQARLTVRIFTHDLDAELYSTPEFHEALSEFARRGARTEVRILVKDPTAAIRRHHALLGLIQHLTSHIGTRRVAHDWQGEISAFLLVDEQGLLWRPYGDQFQGSVDFAAGPRARELREWFDAAWEASQPEPEFRRLGI